MAAELLKRSQAAAADTWAIEDLYDSVDLFLEDARRLEEMVEELKNFTKEYLMECGAHLLEYFQKLEKSVTLLDRTICYSQRSADVDTGNDSSQALSGKMMGIYHKFAAATAPRDAWIASMEEEKLQQFYKETEELGNYRVTISDLRRLKEHTLPPEQEELLASSKEMGEAMEKAYSLLTDADFEHPSVRNEKGEMVKISSGRFVPMLESQDKNVRRETFQAYYARYEQYRNTFAALYEGKAKANFFYAKARNYPSSMEAAVDANNVPKEVYHNLIEAVHENLHYMHQYMSLRKKLMGLEELHMYDVYVPIAAEETARITYQQAQEEIGEALKVLGDDYVRVLKEGFENRWIDVYENEGKRSGAYSAGTRVHPYVLLNYTENLDSEFTLAHEMGHALHSYLSNKNQPVIYADYKIFVAEVASTCNEALLMRYLLAKTEDKKEKAYLINHFLDGFKGTLYRQTMFAEFEQKINQMVAGGEKLTAERLNAIYHDLNVEYYGKDIVVDDYIDVEWARIPHFYMNFYVYQYATGYSAAIALSNKILKEGESAVKDYLNFLSSGCSDDPVSLLKKAGVDMSTAQPIKEALEVFGSLLDELEKLLEE